MLIIACLYIAVGMLGFGYHLRELLTLQKDSVWVELTELVALAVWAMVSCCPGSCSKCSKNKDSLWLAEKLQQQVYYSRG